MSRIQSAFGHEREFAQSSLHLFTYGAACGAIRSITRQSVDVDVVVVVPSEFMNSVHRA